MTSQRTPAPFRYSAVPDVAMSLKPRSMSFLPGSTIAGLSRSLTEMKAVPSTGTKVPPPSWDLAKAPSNAFELMDGPDVLIHLAWGGLPNYNSLHHFEQELPAQYRFLKRLVQSGLKNLVVTGTCFEYGMQSGPLREEMETRPTNPYGLAKDALRRQLEFLKRERSFRLTWVRLFYLYGDGQAENSLLPQLKAAVERGDKGSVQD